MDLLLWGGRLSTLDPSVDPEGAADAVLVRGDRIAAVGSHRVLSRQAAGIDDIDLRGCLVLPGLTDTHTHFFELARRRAGVDLSGAQSVAELRERLSAHARRAADHPDWIGGSGWDRQRYEDAADLDRRLLDEIFPDRPVALESRDFHTLWCNTQALERAGVLSGRQAPQGGEIGRRPDGEPDGLLYETAWELIWQVRPPESPDVASRWALDAMGYAHSLGLTGVHCMEVQSTWELYQRLRGDDLLRLRLCFHSPLDHLEQRIEEGASSYASTDPWLRLGGVKIFMDGSLGSRSAWMSVPYRHGSRGRLLRSQEELESILLRAGRAGIAGSVHAIGDATVGLVARAMQSLRQRLPSAPRLQRVEHAQCVRPEDQLRLAEAGVACAMQAIHLPDDIVAMEREWGELAVHAYPMRSLLRMGVPVALGSDAPVATLDPRQGIHAAVTRRRPGDAVSWHPEQSLSLEEAVAAYTSWAAAFSGREAELGSVTPGKLADFTVLEDPGSDVEAWREAPVRLTVVGGEVVYEARS